MASASKKESVNRNLRSVLITEKAGIALNRLQGEYQTLLGETIPFIEFGFSSLDAYLKSIPSVVSVRRGPTGEVMCSAVADETTKHIASLVSRQKGKKTKGRGLTSKPGRAYAHPTYAMSKARPAGKIYTSRFAPKTGKFNTSFKPAATHQPKSVKYNHLFKPASTQQPKTVKYNNLVRPKETTTSPTVAYTQQSRPTAAQQSRPTAAQQTRPAAAQQTRPAAAQQTIPAAAQQTRPAAAQQTIPAVTQHTRPAAAQQTRPAAAQQSRPAAAQQTIPAAAQQTIPAATQHTRPAAAQHTRPAAAQQARPAAAQQTRPAAAQQTRPAAQQPRAADEDTRPLTPTATQVPTPGPWSGKLGSKRGQQPAKTTTVGATHSSTWKPADDWSATNGLSSKPVHENIHVTIPSDGARQVNSQSFEPVQDNIHVTVSNDGHRQTEVSPQKLKGKTRPGKAIKPEWSSNFEVPPRFKRLVSPTGTTAEGFQTTPEPSLNSDPSPSGTVSQPSSSPTSNVVPELASETCSWIQTVLSKKPNGLWASALCEMHQKEFGQPLDTNIIEQMNKLSLLEKESLSNSDILYPKQIVTTTVSSASETTKKSGALGDPKEKNNAEHRNQTENGTTQSWPEGNEPCTSTKPFDHTIKQFFLENLPGANHDIAHILKTVCKRQNLPLDFHVDSMSQPGKREVYVSCTAGTSVATAHGLTIDTAKQAAASKILQQWNVTPSDLDSTSQVSPDECVNRTTVYDCKTQLQNDKMMRRLRRFGPTEDLEGDEKLSLRDEHVGGFCSCFGGDGNCPFQTKVSPDECVNRPKAIVFDDKAQQQNEKMRRRLKRFGPTEDLADDENLCLRIEHVGGFCSCFGRGGNCPFQTQVSPEDLIDRTKGTVCDDKAQQHEKMMKRLKRFGPIEDQQNHPCTIFSPTRSEDKFCVLNSGKPNYRRATPAVEGKVSCETEEETINISFPTVLKSKVLSKSTGFQLSVEAEQFTPQRMSAEHADYSDSGSTGDNYHSGLSKVPGSNVSFSLSNTKHTITKPSKLCENPLFALHNEPVIVASAATAPRRATEQDIRQALRATFGKTAIYETTKHMGTQEEPIVSVCFIAGAIVGVGKGCTKTKARKAALEDLLRKQSKVIVSRSKSQLQQQAEKTNNFILQESHRHLSLGFDGDGEEVTSELSATNLEEEQEGDEQVASVEDKAGSVKGLQTQAYLPTALQQNEQMSISSSSEKATDFAALKPWTGQTKKPSYGRGYTRWQVDTQSRSYSSPRLPEEDTPSEGYSSPTLGVSGSPSSRPPSTETPSTLGEPCEEGYSSPTSETYGTPSEPSYEGGNSPTIESPGMPSLILPEENEWDLYVAYIKSLSDFYAILIGDDYSEQLIVMEETMRSFYQCSTWVLTEPPEAGVCYAAEFNREWLRVQVVSVEEDEVQCFLLDHGDTENAPISSLRPLAEKFLQLPFQVIHCKLSQCEQVALDDKTALQMFCQLALGKSLLAEVVSRDGDRIEMELFDSSDVSILEQCMTAGI